MIELIGWKQIFVLKKFLFSTNIFDKGMLKSYTSRNKCKDYLSSLKQLANTYHLQTMNNQFSIVNTKEVIRQQQNTCLLAIGNIFEVLYMKDIYKRGIQINTVLELAVQFNNMKVFVLLGIMALAAAKPKGEQVLIYYINFYLFQQCKVYFIAIPFGMGEPITLTICKPTMNNEIKNFRIGIFNSLHQALSNNNLQENFEREPKTATTTTTTITTSTPKKYRNFRARFQWGHLRRQYVWPILLKFQ